MSNQVVLNGLQTEERNPKSTNIDTVSTRELCRIINDEDAQVAGCIRECLTPIAAAIDCLSERVRSGGRVIYVGAGTSGRLGVLDASEIPPTYSAPTAQFVGLIAGGDIALRSAREGAEDSVEAGIDDLKAIQIDGARDSLIGIASSGRTPYVLGCLEYAKSRGCATVGIACVIPSGFGRSGNVDFLIEAVTGPEVVTGSTRMKAGTATKLVLNMISSGIMIRIGKTFGNIMVDVKPTNIKLEHRARRIIREIVPASRSSTDAELDQVLASCDKNVKLAAVVLHFGISVEEAKIRLRASSGVLGALIKSNDGESTTASNEQRERAPEVIICVDAGGSRCKATVLRSDGCHGAGESGACNIAEVGSKAAAREVKLAVGRAIQNFADFEKMTIESLDVVSSWIAIAGGDRKNVTLHLRSELENILPGLHSLRITNDLELLATVAGGQTTANDIIVLISGTGSIAMHYRRQESDFILVNRAGGWGPLLGDDGSGFDIGRKTIRYVLQQLEDAISGKTAKEDVDPLCTAIIDHYRPACSHGADYDLLSTVLLGDSEGSSVPGEAKRRIASCAKVVLDMATTSSEAACICKAAKGDLVALLQSVIRRSKVQPSQASVILAGGILQSTEFRSGVIDLTLAAGLEFMQVKPVANIALDGARHIATRVWQSA